MTKQDPETTRVGPIKRVVRPIKSTTTTTTAPPVRINKHVPPIPDIAPVEGDLSNKIIAFAGQFVGVPYVWGGASPSGFDCSGFVQFVWQNFGISLPHSSGAMRNSGVSVPFANAQPGDILAYSGHVTLYAGNGQMIGATQSGDVVRFQPVRAGFISVRRVANYNSVEKAA